MLTNTPNFLQGLKDKILGSKKIYLAAGLILGLGIGSVHLIFAQRNNAYLVSSENASSIATQSIQGSSLSSIRKDVEDGIPVYEAYVTKDNVIYEVTIHGKTGAILHSDIEGTGTNQVNTTQTTKTSTTTLTLAQAEKIALDKVGGGSVKSAEEDSDDGIAYYDFTIIHNNTKYDIEVEKASGKIRKYKQKALSTPQAATPGAATSTQESSGQNASQTTTSQSTTQTAQQANQTQTTAPQNQTTISQSQAESIAIGTVAGSSLLYTEVDNDETPSFDVYVSAPDGVYEVVIDALSGSVLEVDKDE